MKFFVSFSSNYITKNYLKLKDKDKYGKIDYILIYDKKKETDDSGKQYYMIGIYEQKHGGLYEEEELKKVLEYIKKKKNYQILNNNELE